MNFIASPDRYGTMKYARCGRSCLMLPRISLGLWHNFGNVDRYATARDVVLRAFDLGITHFDVANNYGPPPGSAETNFGRMLRDDLQAYRDEIVVSTKAGYHMWPGPYGEWGSRKNLLASLDQSLRRMRLDYVDIFYSHRPDPQTPLEETMGALAQAVRNGKALHAGISNYQPADARKAAALLRSLGTPCLFHQPSYSMLNRWIEEGLTTVLEEEGVGCIVFSPLAQGQLTGRYLREIPADSRAARGGFLKADQVRHSLPKVQALSHFAERRGQSLAQMAIAWVLRLPAVTSALLGASSTAQLEENLKALDHLDFSSEELMKIESALRVEP
jgi:L-glyceraldehyde 3-phosphate reductase